MTCQLKITPEAENDIFAIAANIKQQIGLSAAKHAIAEFKNQLNRLSEFPGSGRAGGCEGTWEVVMTGLPYIIVYEYSESLLTIVRVLYGAEERRLTKREETIL